MTSKITISMNPDNIKTIQEDLNKSLKLNQQLLDEQTESEIDFKKILDSNTKLKYDMVKMVEHVEILKQECMTKDKLLCELQKDYPDYENTLRENKELLNNVQKLTDEMNRCKQDVIDINKVNEELKHKLENLGSKSQHVHEKLTANTVAEKNINDMSKELTAIRRELKFKNAELRVLRKRRTTFTRADEKNKNTKVSLFDETHNEIKELEEKYDKLLADNDKILKNLKENEQKLKEQVIGLEATCSTIRNRYDNLSIKNNNTEQKNCELLQTIEQLEYVLKEDEVLNIQSTKEAINKSIKTKSSDAIPMAKHMNKAHNTIVIIGDESIRGLGSELRNHLQTKIATCCHVFPDAPTSYLVNIARGVAKSQKPSTIILMTRKMTGNIMNRYVDDIICLNETLKEMNVRLICSNLQYKRGRTPLDGEFNRIVYNHNMKLHNYSTYDSNVEIINQSSISTKITSRELKSIVIEYIAAHIKNFFQRNLT